MRRIAFAERRHDPGDDGLGVMWIEPDVAIATAVLFSVTVMIVSPVVAAILVRVERGPNPAVQRVHAGSIDQRQDLHVPGQSLDKPEREWFNLASHPNEHVRVLHGSRAGRPQREGVG